MTPLRTEEEYEMEGEISWPSAAIKITKYVYSNSYIINCAV
jgi:hypothetical protein